MYIWFCLPGIITSVSPWTCLWSHTAAHWTCKGKQWMWDKGSMLKWDSKAEEVIIIILGTHKLWSSDFFSFLFFFPLHMNLIHRRDSAGMYVYQTLFSLLLTTCHSTVLPFPDTRWCSTMRMVCSRSHLTWREMGSERWAQSRRQHREGTIRWQWEEDTHCLRAPGCCCKDTVAVDGKDLRRVRMSLKYLFTDLIGLIS